jgi:alkanesulfonate monooxygenase SsuD/methylene tetrahydromethanopterin reductase-like flavin-dependent oxidoreductase (luciferase family)
MGERVAAMKEIWTKDEAEYHGRYVAFDPIWSWPKPVQKPFPPIHIAGEGIHTLRRVAEYGDGWLPILARGKEPFPESVARLNRMGAELGRGPFPVSIFGAPTDPDEIRRLAEQGATGFIFRLSSPDDRDVMHRELDELAKVVRAVRAGG